MKKVNIGLDIGIASVGWAVFDIENKKILDAGSRLFEEANNSNSSNSSTSDRRLARGTRRRLRRLTLRKHDLLKLYVKYGFLDEEQSFYKLNFNFNSLEKRKFALENAININELLVILYGYIKRRGTFNYADDKKELKRNNQDENESLLDKFNFPVDIQLYLYEKNNKYRALNDIDSLIPHNKYVLEIEKILDTQIKNNVVNVDFKNDFLEIFNRKREYFDGPGPANKKGDLSPFGWNGEDEFINRLTGKDTYDKNELRAPKESLTAYLFNILNDLNNLKIESPKREAQKLTYEEKKHLIVTSLNPNKADNITLKKIAKYLGVSANEIKGARIDSKNKPIFSEFKTLAQIRNDLKNKNLSTDFIKLENIVSIDRICNVLFIYQTIDSRYENLKKLNIDFLTDDHCKVIAEISSSGTHSLSLKTMNIAIDEMWHIPENQMQVFSRLKMTPQYALNVKEENLKTIPVLRKQIEDMYISPVVKRSFIEAVKIIKELQRLKIYDINDVVIELARESNSEDYKKFINEINKRNNESNKRVMEQYGINVPTNSDITNTKTSKTNGKLLLKFALLLEQNGKCAYSGATINPDLLKTDPNYCEVDHIIPFSWSFDDSKANKVLVLSKENQEKGQRTPWQYMGNNNSKWEKFKERCVENYFKIEVTKYSMKKYYNLIDQTDYSKAENRKDFISRNLNDTRYATVEVKNYLREFGKNHFKVKTINGSFTSYIRSKFLYLDKKDRDKYEHHAIDAIVCAISPLLKLDKLDETIGEIEAKIKEQQVRVANKIIRDDAIRIKEDIQNFNFKFSWKVQQKTNKQLFNDTIYTGIYKENPNTGEKEVHKVLKLDLFKDDKKLEEFFINKPYQLFMYHDDRKTFDYLLEIYKAYKIDEKGNKITNPFRYFKEVLNKPIEKQSNETVRPKISKLRYIDSDAKKTFNDISHKFRNISEDKIIFTEGSNFLGWDLYQSIKTDKYKIVPLNSKLVKFGNEIIYKESYNNEIKNLLNQGYIYKIRLNKDDEVKFKYNGIEVNYRIIGYRTSEQLIEFKEISLKNNKRIIISINKISNLKIVKSNSTKTKIKIIN